MISSNITDIIISPDKKGYVDVYADGELLISISEDAYIQSGIRIGDTVDEKKLTELEYTVCLTKAKAKAYDYLSYGDMSAKTLCTKLVRYGISQHVASDVVCALEKEGYIDDARYALSYANYLAVSKLYGIRRIKKELFIKGIDKTLADEVICQLDVDFYENLRILVSKKGAVHGRKEASKLIAHLVRYGYEYEDIKSIVSDLEDQYE